MTVKVNYGGAEPFSVIPPHTAKRPYLPVRLHSNGKYWDTFGLVDSGADITMFNEAWAAPLGLVLTPGTEKPIGGIGGGAFAWFFDIHLTVKTKRFAARVGFGKTIPREFGLLGRESFFDAFRLGFGSPANELLYNTQPTPPAAAPPAAPAPVPAPAPAAPPPAPTAPPP